MTVARSTRINARLPPETARKLAWLERRTRKTTTEVILASIDHLYAAEAEGTGDAARILAEAGFLGAFEGPADLSSSYKAELARSLEKKA